MDFNNYRQTLEESARKERHAASPYKEFTSFILGFVKGRCLEIGCGDGLMTRLLKENCGELVSVDLSANRIETARKSAGKSAVRFILSDARALPFKDSYFDTVVAFEVIEHLPGREEQSQVLREVKRVLSADGRLVISTPNKPVFRLYCKILKEKHSTHFSEMDYFSFRGLLKKHFSSVKIYGRFGWLSPFYGSKIVRKAHSCLSGLTPFCKGLTGVCKKH
ncbi:MAG: class I SAM-dependent methyltransferase [Candidatus Omnitrophica bacterium]|nr:class I SAM-dependent methyltransferase [Candidatus Omnitrophota bacterium]